MIHRLKFFNKYLEGGKMEIKGKVWCMFEQSGTFKNEFKKLGIDAVDLDIQNNFGETDYVIDLFGEINKAYDNLTRQDKTRQDKTRQYSILLNQVKTLSLLSFLASISQGVSILDILLLKTITIRVYQLRKSFRRFWNEKKTEICFTRYYTSCAESA